MKLSSINSVLVLETVQDQIQSIADKSGLSVEEVSELVRKVGLKQWKWVLNQWHKGSINLPPDSEKVNELIVNFEKVKSKLDIKDINQYKSVEELKSSVEPLLDIKSSKKKREYENLEGVEIVSRKGPYVVLKVSNADSLAALGIGTKWCTRDDHPECRSEQYIGRYGHIFVVLQNGRPVMQYTSDYNEIMDISNYLVEDPGMLSLIPKPEINENSTDIIYNYAYKVLRDRWPEAEPYIAKNPAVAYRYARDVIDGEWPEAEPYIMKEPALAYGYAKDIIDDRWPEAEPYIMKEPGFAIQYAVDFIGDRWPEAESYIMKGPHDAFEYAHRVIRGRWPEAEHVILRSPESCVRYARYVIEDRWPEAEPIIMEDPESIYMYVRGVIQDRWPEAEPTIAKHAKLKHAYNRYIEDFVL
jgi:hypothetical protein